MSVLSGTEVLFAVGCACGCEIIVVPRKYRGVPIKYPCRHLQPGACRPRVVAKISKNAGFAGFWAFAAPTDRDGTQIAFPAPPKAPTDDVIHDRCSKSSFSVPAIRAAVKWRKDGREDSGPT